MPEYHINNLAGWAGDLQTLMLDVLKITKDSNDYNTIYNKTKELVGYNGNKYSFSITDLLADVDAVNINSILKSTSSLSDTIQDYSETGYKTRYIDYIKKVADKVNKKKFSNLVYIYTKSKYFAFGWPLLGGKKISKTQSKAFRDAFTDFIWDKVQQDK